MGFDHTKICRSLDVPINMYIQGGDWTGLYLLPTTKEMKFYKSIRTCSNTNGSDEDENGRCSSIDTINTHIILLLVMELASSYQSGPEFVLMTCL